MSAPSVPTNEFFTDGIQTITTTDGVGTILSSTQLTSSSYTTGALTTTWSDTHSTIFNARSLQNNVNPQILAIEKAILLLNDNTTPTASIGIEADNSGGIGTYYGMNLFNNTNLDFGITSTFPYQGSVVFDQEGAGSTTTKTAIKQGTITVSDTATAPNTVITDTSIVIDDNFATTTPFTATLTSGNLEIKNVNGPALTTTTTDINPANIVLADTGQPTTTFTTTTLTSGASSATWADIISGSAGSNTLQEVLTAGNIATTPVASFGINDGAGLSSVIFSGEIDLEFDDGISPAVLTTFTPTTLTSGASSATWADIISGSAGSNTLQEVLTAGNTASNLNITLTGASGSQMTLSPVSSNLGAIETFAPVVPFNTAQSLISLGAGSGNLTSTMDIFDNTTPISYQISGQIVQAGDRINDVYNVKPEVQLSTQYIDGMGTILKTAKYQVSGITHQSTTPYEINSPANIGITANNVILTSNNLTSTTDTLTVKSGGFGYTTNPNIIIENNLASAGNTVGVPSVEYYKSGRITVLNDVIMSQQFNARAYNNVKTTFGKIECSITGNSAPTGIDGALDFYTCINGVNQNVMRLNGADNENNTFRPFDLNGNALKTSVSNMTIDASSSTGTGSITLATKDGTAGSGGGLLLTGNTLLSATASGNSGQHLAITIGGTVYKIQLLNN